MQVLVLCAPFGSMFNVQSCPEFGVIEASCGRSEEEMR